ncbi:MAG: hypothetical protein FJ312_07105 [SAR202 cluster bacterium]|nr:hypothetical protein [SAR202 cluster bacterium]
MLPVRRVSLLALVLVVAAFGAMASACGGDGGGGGAEGSDIRVVSVTAADFSFTSPDFFNQGMVRLAFTNSGQETHHLQILKLKSGVIQAKFKTTLNQILSAVPTEGEADFNRLYEIADFSGGAGPADPGGYSEAVLSLESGVYVYACFIAGADGVPHIAKGMTRVLTVNPDPGTKQPAPPTASATVDMVDFAFTGITATLPAGKTTLAVVNKGQQSHEMSILRLKGITAADLRKALTDPNAAPPAGPPPYESAGGFRGTAPGGTGWAVVNLTPGEYVLVCFIPDPADGKPHAAKGMFKPLTVQ